MATSPFIKKIKSRSAVKTMNAATSLSLRGGMPASTALRYG